jgi:hypothetical protein
VGMCDRGVKSERAFLDQKILGLLQDNVQRPWHWGALSRNRGITLDMVQKLPDAPWDWARLSCNPSVTWTDIRSTRDSLAWDWAAISTWAHLEHVLDEPDVAWDWRELSLSRHLSLEDVLSQPDLPWDVEALRFTHSDSLDVDPPVTWRGGHPLMPLLPEEFPGHLWQLLSADEGVTASFVEQHIDAPWDFGELSSNAGAHRTGLLDTIRKHPDKPWDWFSLSYINLLRMPTPEWDAALTIQRWWLNIFYDPDSDVCRRRLLRECESFRREVAEASRPGTNLCPKKRPRDCVVPEKNKLQVSDPDRRNQVRVADSDSQGVGPCCPHGLSEEMFQSVPDVRRAM